MELDRDDLSEIFSDHVDLYDERYSWPSIYKYYNFSNERALRSFITRPTIKFAHKSELNDPFELLKRWEKFGCPLTENVFNKFVRPRLPGARLAPKYMSGTKLPHPNAQRRSVWQKPILSR